MKKLGAISIIVCFMLLFTTACRSKSKPADAVTAQTASESSMTSTTLPTSTAASSTPIDTQPSETIGELPSDAIILNNDSIDLNGDGNPEKITIYQLGTKSADGIDEIEGRLRVEGGKAGKDISFIKKQAGLTGVFTSAEYSDLDGDGTKDIFIITPDSGAQFNMSYFSMYSFSLDKIYTFNIDNELNEFAAGFTFKYRGKGLLEMTNSSHSFSAELDISDNDEYSPENEEANQYYNKSWVEPVPVDIGAGSTLKLDTADGSEVIRVPLPIFGQATINIIGEVDLCYRVTNNFIPAAYKFEVYDFKGMGKKKIGEGLIK